MSSSAGSATPPLRRTLARLGASLLALLALPASTEPATWRPGQPGESLEVALLTVAPGEIYWQRFGHNAILLRDRASGSERLYNYGLFDFSERDFLRNFLRGRMRYQMGGALPEADLAGYRAEGREVRLQWLNLAPPERLALARFLEWNRQPGNNRYDYDYFLTNCSTKVRDALDQALGGAIERATGGRSRGFTYRHHALRLTAPDLPLYLGIHAGLGPFADQRLTFWQEMFVPMELARHLAEVTITDDDGATRPLVAEDRIVEPGLLPAPPAYAPNWFWRFLGCGLALALAIALLAGRRRAAPRRALGTLLALAWLVAGLGGLVLLSLWALTAHVSAHANHNLLLFNPLALGLLPAALGLLRGRAPSARACRLAWLVATLAAAAWFLLVLPWFVQDSMDWIGLWLPLHLAGAFALGREHARVAR